MKHDLTNKVSQEIDRLAKKFGYRPSSIASKAFKNSRKAEQLKRRDDGDAASLEKLKTLEEELEEERRRQLHKLFPQSGKASVELASITSKESNL